MYIYMCSKFKIIQESGKIIDINDNNILICNTKRCQKVNLNHFINDLMPMEPHYDDIEHFAIPQIQGGSLGTIKSIPQIQGGSLGTIKMIPQIQGASLGTIKNPCLFNYKLDPNDPSTCIFSVRTTMNSGIECPGYSTVSNNTCTNPNISKTQPNTTTLPICPNNYDYDYADNSCKMKPSVDIFCDPVSTFSNGQCSYAGTKSTICPPGYSSDVNNTSMCNIVVPRYKNPSLGNCLPGYINQGNDCVINSSNNSVNMGTDCPYGYSYDESSYYDNNMNLITTGTCGVLGSLPANY